jgi:hypothetical protein
MDLTRVVAMIRTLTQPGGVMNYTWEQARLLVGILRAVAEGCPVDDTRIDRLAEEVGMARDEARAFRSRTERDVADRVIGVLRLSQGDHPHRFVVNGEPLSAWCAEDTLFLPALLGQPATVEPPSPVSGETVRLTVGPKGFTRSARLARSSRSSPSTRTRQTCDRLRRSGVASAATSTSSVPARRPPSGRPAGRTSSF